MHTANQMLQLLMHIIFLFFCDPRNHACDYTPLPQTAHSAMGPGPLLTHSCIRMTPTTITTKVCDGCKAVRNLHLQRSLVGQVGMAYTPPSSQVCIPPKNFLYIKTKIKNTAPSFDASGCFVADTVLLKPRRHTLCLQPIECPSLY